MAEPEIGVILRTFSGPNLGAEVMLPPGTYIIGTDFSCDVVLSDSGMAPRHAALTVEKSREGRVPRVHVKPLDAEIMFNDNALAAEGLDIPPVTPWFLGLTCLAWNTPDAPRETLIPRLPGQAPLVPAQTDPTIFVGEGAEKNADVISGNDIGDTLSTPLPRRWPVWLMVLLILVAVAALAVDFRPEANRPETVTAKFRYELQQAGFSSLVVSTENDRITVSGSVLNEKERTRLWSMAQSLRCPVYIQVRVREDLAQAVTMKLNASGIFPEVILSGEDQTLHMAAYIKDIQTENAVFASLDKDLPGLPKIEKRIVHASRLKAMIEHALDHAQLQNIQVSMGVGRMELTDPSSIGNHEALQQVMKRIEKNLNIPLVYTIISRDMSPADGSPVTPLAPGGISPEMRPPSPEGFTLADLQITGVTLRPMRFIRLANGQRVFEGGMLPGGHVLENISLDTLALSKNGRTTTYLLRGINE